MYECSHHYLKSKSMFFEEKKYWGIQNVLTEWRTLILVFEAIVLSFLALFFQIFAYCAEWLPNALLDHTASQSLHAMLRRRTTDQPQLPKQVQSGHCLLRLLEKWGKGCLGIRDK